MDEYGVLDNTDIPVEKECNKSRFCTKEGLSDLKRFYRVSYANIIYISLTIIIMIGMLLPFAFLEDVFSYGESFLHLCVPIFILIILVFCVISVVLTLTSHRSLSKVNSFFAEAYVVRKKQLLFGFLSNVGSNALRSTNTILGDIAGSAVEVGNAVYQTKTEFIYFGLMYDAFCMELSKIGCVSLINKGEKVFNSRRKLLRITIMLAIIYIVTALTFTIIGLNTSLEFLFISVSCASVAFIGIAYFIAMFEEKKCCDYYREVAKEFENQINAN